MRISDWSSDVCSSDLQVHLQVADVGVLDVHADRSTGRGVAAAAGHRDRAVHRGVVVDRVVAAVAVRLRVSTAATTGVRSEEHTSELQSLMRISYAVFCLKNKHQISST